MIKAKNLDYSNIVLQPSQMPGTISSRDKLDTNIEFLSDVFKSPILPANMACTISFELAELLSANNYFYILHRFYDYEEIFKWVEKSQHALNIISISIGVKQKDYEFLDRLKQYNYEVDYITIDVSHGHHNLVKNMAAKINKTFPHTRIIAGNVTTKKACLDYKKWGIDAAKVGLARGKACSTFNQTGVGSFMFSAIEECAASKLPIIADGGIREIKDMSIAMVGGANLVMVGSLFAACEDSPAKTIEPYVGSDTQYKVYYGSASAKNKGHNKYIEGEDAVWLTPNKMKYLDYYQKIKDGMVSTMSFANVTQIKDLKTMNYLVK